ncbi:MAG: hypothetical protein ACNS62_23955 [Candidatus Cyclobacteriaceae bacterium M3_2C_046]
MLRYIVIVIFLFSSPLFCNSQNIIYDGSDNVNIILDGYQNNFEYQSEEFMAQFDRDKKQFEFIIPLNSIEPADKDARIELIHNLFRPHIFEKIKITTYLPKNLLSLKDFRDPQKYELDAMLSLFGSEFEAPLVLSLLSSQNALFYNLRVNVDLNKYQVVIPEAYQDYLTGIVSFTVTDAHWVNFFNQ